MPAACKVEKVLGLNLGLGNALLINRKDDTHRGPPCKLQEKDIEAIVGRRIPNT